MYAPKLRRSDINHIFNLGLPATSRRDITAGISLKKIILHLNKQLQIVDLAFI